MIPSALKQVGAGFRHLLFPLRCNQCNINLFNQILPACPVCMAGIESVDESVLGLQIDDTAMEEGVHLQITYAHWFFDKVGLVQYLHRSLKYKNLPIYGVELGKMMGRSFVKKYRNESIPDLLIPVPLHTARLIERGYNQSAMLTRGFSESTLIPECLSVLTRHRATRSQTGLDRQDRRSNVASAFSAYGGDQLKAKHVLLIDDVMTTGSTLLAAAHTLSDAGAERISIATLAFARP